MYFTHKCMWQRSTLPNWGVSISTPSLKSGVFIQYAVSCSSGDTGEPWSMPPRHRPIRRAIVLSRSTSHTYRTGLAEAMARQQGQFLSGPPENKIISNVSGIQDSQTFSFIIALQEDIEAKKFYNENKNCNTFCIYTLYQANLKYIQISLSYKNWLCKVTNFKINTETAHGRIIPHWFYPDQISTFNTE